MLKRSNSYSDACGQRKCLFGCMLATASNFITACKKLVSIVINCKNTRI